MICKKLSIPTPPPGHWSKIKHGKKINNIPLSLLAPSGQDSIVIYLWESDEDDEIDITKKLAKKLKSIVVSKNLTNLSPIVVKTYNSLKKEQADIYNRLKTLNPNCLDVDVSANCIDRALRIMNALITELTRHGFYIHTESSYKYLKSYLIIENEKIYFKIYETVRRQKKPIDSTNDPKSWTYHKYDYVPTGNLKLVIYSEMYSETFTIEDNSSLKLEKQLDNFLPILFKYSLKVKREREKNEQWNKEWKEKQRAIKEKERKWELELKHRDHLEEQAELFTKSQYIYQFIDDIQRTGNDLKLDKKQRDKLLEWIVWAREHADRLDPVKQMVD